MTRNAPSIEAALRELDKSSPGAPLLALGQTVLWDEPMKGGVALVLQAMGSDRKFFAGVHDTDYFAKLPGPAAKQKGRFAAVPHNDTTTRGLWSAAGEFSALFGSETVISRQDYLNAGLRLATVTRSRPGIMDEATEAWRWRGIVSLDEDPPLACEVPLDQVFTTLQETLDWALEETANSLPEPSRPRARGRIDELHAILCDHVEQADTLTDFYKAILPATYGFAAGQDVPLHATTTRELLQINARTASFARFGIVDLFINPITAGKAKEAYNEAIRGSEIYDLSRFGSGSIPFDLYIPGKGRGTIRLGRRGAVIMTREPQFLSFKKPLSGIQEFGEAVESKFGPDCVLIGKAVTLIGMLSREFVFVFHEGASSYVKHTRKFHENLRTAGFADTYHPILRVRYNAWESLGACCSWLDLPEPLRSAFGTQELSGPSLAGRLSEVAKAEAMLLERLAKLKRPLDLIRYLDEEVGGNWKALAAEYQSLHTKLEGLAGTIRELTKERRACYGQLREQRQQRVRAEVAKGEHFRAFIFEKSPSSESLRKREELTQQVDVAIRGLEETKQAIAELMQRQRDRVSDSEVQAWHERRREIELEAELKRMRLIQRAIISSKGLARAGKRPSAWWFPIVCPMGSWFRDTIERAEAYLEPL